ncbi:phosphatidate cytidylyltransferase [Klebsiella pneumoniae]
MLKYRLISAFVLIPIVIAALFLLPPMGFAIVTLVVCMLAAWEWGRLSGFTSTSQRVWLAVLCGLLLAAMLFCCLNTTMTFINRWLKGRYGPLLPGGSSRYCWCSHTRRRRHSGATLRCCASSSAF